jgi:hypothetical protein
MATVAEHGCGWGMLRLRGNGWDNRDRVSHRRSGGSRNRILMESLSAVPWHRPALYFRRVVLSITVYPGAKAGASSSDASINHELLVAFDGA